LLLDCELLSNQSQNWDAPWHERHEG
jgi:hypothetical protein